VIKSLAVSHPTRTVEPRAEGVEGPVAIGVVGAGLVAQVVHLPLLQRLGGLYRVTSLAEPDAAVREAVAARHAIAGAHADHRSLLEAGGIEALLVCSPDATHAQVVVDALEAGLHVLVEKPLCLTPEEGEWIVAARDRAGLVVQVGYMKRYDPAVEALLDELPPGWTPLHITTATFDPGLRQAFGTRPAAAAMRVEEAFLGALIHDVNLVHAILARSGSRAVRIVDAFGDETRAGGTIELDGGARWTAVWLALPGAGTFREHIALYAADGVRELEFPAPYALHEPTVYRHLRAGGEGAIATARTSWREAYERQLRHFHAAITGATACRTPAEEGVADVRLLTQLLTACGAGAAV
jgi:predicted dehydrogenase